MENVLLQSLLLFYDSDGHSKVLLLIYFYFFILCRCCCCETKPTSWKIIVILIIALFFRIHVCVCFFSKRVTFSLLYRLYLWLFFPLLLSRYIRTLRIWPLELYYVCNSLASFAFISNWYTREIKGVSSSTCAFPKENFSKVNIQVIFWMFCGEKKKWILFPTEEING